MTSPLPLLPPPPPSSSSSSSLPRNVHLSSHPCLRAKLSLLRSASINARETKALVHDIALILGVEATAKGLSTNEGPEDATPLGYTYRTQTISPSTISLIPILRSGLGMLEALQTLLPSPVPVHHLGLYRSTNLEPVEYYNNLPHHIASGSNIGGNPAASSLAILLDPVIATGGTCVAAVQTLREWGVGRVIVISVLGARPGVLRAAEEWSEGTEIWLAGLDEEVTETGMIKPGLGDVGDRLFLTVGK